MTTTSLGHLLSLIEQAIEHFGAHSPCFYSIWTADDFQEQKKWDYQMLCEEYPEGHLDHPDPFKPWTDEQMHSIAKMMMENYSPTKEYIAYSEAINLIDP